MEYKHVFLKVNSPAVSAGVVGVGESAEVDVVAGMVPEGTTSDMYICYCMCKEHCDTMSYTLTTPLTIIMYVRMNCK